jgi:NADPH-dependent curcumin reductase CurA
MRNNLQVRLIARPVGMPRAEDFRIEEASVPEVSEGELLVQVRYISLDPAMRGWMDDRPSYLPPVGLGQVMRATAIGEVLQSRSTLFKAGDCVMGHLGVQTVAVVRAQAVRRVDTTLAPIDVHIGLLSTAGLTAYFGLLDTGQPLAGETVVVSGAAGAVGSVVGQIARIKGCRAVGVAGGSDKCTFLTDTLGYDRAVDYKADDFKLQLAGACANGIDVFFDNVGNPVLDLALRYINLRARIVLCGAISQYNSTGKVDGPQNYIALIVKRAMMKGLIVFDYESRYAEATAQLAAWWRSGSVVYRADVTQGIERFHEALLRLFAGKTKGKAVLQV